MRSPKKTTAIVLAGAVGLSSVAYGIGTQVGDGSSLAADRNNAASQPGFVPLGLDDLANELGVETDALGDALRDYHEQKHAEMRSAFAAALADALGKSAEDVEAALDSIESKRQARFVDRLAQALGADAAAVRAALEELRNERPGPGDFPAALAAKLGVEADDVAAALMEVRPPRGPRPELHHPAVALRQLASELGVTRAELRKALRKVRADADPDRKDRRDDLVKFLAERFDLSEAQVDDALPKFPGPGPGGPQGPCGPGGPGGFGRFGPGPGGPPPGMP
jgi:hypothetical protein